MIGVSPAGFYGLNLSNDPDVRVPMMMTTVFNPLPATRLKSRRHQWLTLMARRKSEVSPAQAQAGMDVLYKQLIEFEGQSLPADISAFDREQFLSRKLVLQPGAQGFQSVQTEMRTSLLLSLAEPLSSFC